MTSVVDTSVKHFHSGMVGAPVLNGVAGSLIGLLNACLVTGFDTKAATSLVVAAGVATLSFSGTHSATVDSVILVSGSSIAAIDGEQKVTAISSGVVKFATSEPDGTATGTITFKMAPAGWMQPFIGTNLATYKSADPASTGMILHVDDTAAQLCRVVGYESMTDVNTGLGAFPTTAQISGGGYWHKSGAASAVATQWVIVTDGRKFILSNAPWYFSAPNYAGSVTRGFGDDLALRPGGDVYACSLSYSISASVYSCDGGLDYGNLLQQAMPRGYTGLGSCVLHLCAPYVGNPSYASGMDTFMGDFPSLVDGGLRFSRKFFATSTNTPPRSNLPGLYHVPQAKLFDYFKTKDTIQGSGTLVGRTLICLSVSSSPGNASNNSNTGASFVDITGPWR
jgi:hypothetical protein